MFKKAATVFPVYLNSNRSKTFSHVIYPLRVPSAADIIQTGRSKVPARMQTHRTPAVPADIRCRPSRFFVFAGLYFGIVVTSSTRNSDTTRHGDSNVESGERSGEVPAHQERGLYAAGIGEEKDTPQNIVVWSSRGNIDLNLSTAKQLEENRTDQNREERLNIRELSSSVVSLPKPELLDSACWLDASACFSTRLSPLLCLSLWRPPQHPPPSVCRECDSAGTDADVASFWPGSATGVVGRRRRFGPAS
ncbi:hypothetical protein HPB51_017494 [Rhipicephalus microplus]|uniref:Uncharacterized protein n=1 Tax=Rhipicephalus microplus TaxID=6941 RepID=A0A9J6F583_RHIMP|nr:hypothetical protein HPB51_017494 [Rhipicephalus microplus]